MTTYYLYAGENRLIVEPQEADGKVGSILLPDNNSLEAYTWARILANFEEHDKACAPYEEYAWIRRGSGIPIVFEGKNCVSVKLDEVFAISTTTDGSEEA